MSIGVYKGPDGSEEAVAKTLFDLGYVRAEPIGGASHGDRGAADGQHDVEVYLTPPIAVRTLPSKALLESNCFELAALTTWRYVAPSIPAMIDVGKEDGTPGRIATGPLIDYFIKATHVATKEFGNATRSYTMGIFEIPALQMSALTLEG